MGRATKPPAVKTPAAKRKGASKAGAPKGKGKKKGPKKPKMAETADKYVLYQQSVQNPAYEAKILRGFYKDAYGKKPTRLREDFSGTFAVCCKWVKGKPEREAWAVDLDPEPLAWGEQHNLRKLSPEDQKRVHIVEGDVLTAPTPKVDVVAAMNFSFFIFKTRDALRAYFKAAYDALDEQGILAADMFGGYEVHEDDREDITDHGKFDYVWDQHKFDPVTGDYTFHIHFRFKDKSELNKAFTYEWRLWSIPEVRELMLEAGFKEVAVYWEDSDEDGDGNGHYSKVEHGDADPAWLAYLVGIK